MQPRTSRGPNQLPPARQLIGIVTLGLFWITISTFGRFAVGYVLLGLILIPAIVDFLVNISSLRARPSEPSQRPILPKPSVRIESLKTDAYQLSRFFLYTTATFVFVAVPLTIVGLASLLGPSTLRPLQSASFVSLFHALALALLPVLFMYGIIYWSKNASKHRRLLRIQRSVAELMRTLHTIYSVRPEFTRHLPRADQAQLVRESIDRLLRDLLDLTERQRQISAFLYSRKPAKTAWVFIPAKGQRRFRPVHVYPELAAYEGIKKTHRPAMWDERELRRLDRQLDSARAQLKGPDLQEAERRISAERLAYASLAGYVFTSDGPRLFPHLDLAEANNTYVPQIPELYQETHLLRSGAGTVLRMGNDRIGVLMLFDTLNSGFLGADIAPITIYSQLLAPLIHCAIEIGLYPEDQL